MSFNVKALGTGVLYLIVDFLSWLFMLTFEDKISYELLGLPFVVIFLLTFLWELKESKKAFLTQPPALFSILMIFNIYVSYFLVLYFEDIAGFSSFSAPTFYYVNTLLLTNVAVHTLWVSFRFFSGASLPVDRLGEFAFIRKRYLFIIIAFAVVANLIGISTGAVGFTNRGTDAIEATSSFSQYILIVMNLSYLCFIALVWFYYDKRKYRPIIIGIFIGLFALGLLFGSKSVSVFYAVYFGMTIYFKTYKIKLAYVLVLLFGVVVAYTVIEPMRFYYGWTGGKAKITNVFELVSFYKDALEFQSSMAKKNERAIGLVVLTRLSYTIPLARSMEYADVNNYKVPYNANPAHIIFSPFYSFIPRGLWKSKPLADFSTWVGTDVMNIRKELRVAVGITPQGYCYMTGGYSITILIFILIGFFHRLIYNTFFKNKNYIPFYIFFLLKIHTPDPLIWAFMSGTIRTLLIYWLLYYFMTSKIRPV